MLRALSPSGTGRSGSPPTARSGSGWRAPRRAWPAGAGCARRPSGPRRSTRSPTPGCSSVSRVNTLPGCVREELQQLVLHVGEVERAGGDGGLVGLEVEHERAVLDQLRAATPCPCARRGGAAGPRAPGVERGEAEVVEEVVAQLEVGQVGAGDEQEQRARRARRACAAPGTARRRRRGRCRRRRWRRSTRRPARRLPRRARR